MSEYFPSELLMATLGCDASRENTPLRQWWTCASFLSFWMQYKGWFLEFKWFKDLGMKRTVLCSYKEVQRHLNHFCHWVLRAGRLMQCSHHGCLCLPSVFRELHCPVQASLATDLLPQMLTLHTATVRMLSLQLGFDTAREHCKFGKSSCHGQASSYAY